MWVYVCYSLRKTNMSQFDIAKQLYEKLSDVYWQQYRDMEHAHIAMKQARVNMENACTHNWIRDWEDRDERSRSKCSHCNKKR